MKKYKALMLDLDGTVVPSNETGMPSQVVCDAIAKARKKLHVGVVTGRAYTLVKPIVHILNLSGPGIVSGGAQIVDMHSGEVLWGKNIPYQQGQAILQQIKTFDTRDIFVQRVGEKGALIDHMDKNNTRDIIMMTAQVKSTIRDEVMNSLHSFTDISVHHAIGWVAGHDWVQISHKEATKQHGIYAVAKSLGIDPSEIIGVGDSNNDFPLLMACGLKVAMGNAGEDLKAIADYVAPSVDEDGVADVIEKFIL